MMKKYPVPPIDMKSKDELTPAERLLNRCSWCLMPPMIMQIPCTDEEVQHVKDFVAGPNKSAPAGALTGMKRIQPSKVPVRAALTISS